MTEEIAAILATMDAIKPFDMSDSEYDAWEADRQFRKNREKGQFFERADGLRKLWE